MFDALPERCNEIIDQQGWTLETVFELLCEYISNQDSDDALIDFFEEHILTDEVQTE